MDLASQTVSLPQNPSVIEYELSWKGLNQSGFIVDLKIIVLDEFREELGVSKEISLIYEGGFDEFKRELG